jgi:hypothetical protein
MLQHPLQQWLQKALQFLSFLVFFIFISFPPCICDAFREGEFPCKNSQIGTSNRPWIYCNQAIIWHLLSLTAQWPFGLLSQCRVIHSWLIFGKSIGYLLPLIMKKIRQIISMLQVVDLWYSKWFLLSDKLRQRVPCIEHSPKFCR